MTKEEAAGKVKAAREQLERAEKEIADAAQIRALILSIPGQTLVTVLAALRGSANNYCTRDEAGNSVNRDTEAYRLVSERAERLKNAEAQLSAALYALDRLEYGKGGAA